MCETDVLKAALVRDVLMETNAPTNDADTQTNDMHSSTNDADTQTNDMHSSTNDADTQTNDMHSPTNDADTQTKDMLSQSDRPTDVQTKRRFFTDERGRPSDDRGRPSEFFTDFDQGEVCASHKVCRSCVELQAELLSTQARARTLQEDLAATLQNSTALLSCAEELEGDRAHYQLTLDSAHRQTEQDVEVNIIHCYTTCTFVAT